MNRKSLIIITVLLSLAAVGFKWGSAMPSEPPLVNSSANGLAMLESSDLNLTRTSCNILLVADDWDSTSTMGGGRLYYTTALDNLEYDYDLWDTISQGEPTTADMAPYQAVVWFSGSVNVTPFTDKNENAVADYLDAGGSLLLSSLDYYYTSSLTWFMQDYLGVSAVECDKVELDPVGVSGNPIGDGLGPYSMVRPDQWGSYWPIGAVEGPYDDYVYANNRAGTPFKYNSSGEGNSTNYDGQVFRTVFLAWPVEWVADVGQRAEILGASLDWLCARGADLQVNQTASPTPVYTGQTLTYNITVSNLGPNPAESVWVTDTLLGEVSYISTSPGCLQAGGILSCDIGQLANGASATVTMVVTSPATPTMLVSQVSVTSVTHDPDLGNNRLTLVTPVTELRISSTYMPQVNKH
jgi:uncharacterized repeat protein (TIGR01451 family)